MTDFDTQQLNLAKQGDRDAISQMIESFRPVLVAMARKLISPDLRQKIDAEDVVQDVALLVLRHHSQIQAENRTMAASWICTLLRNRATSIRATYRSKKRSVDREERQAADSRGDQIHRAAARVSTPSRQFEFDEFLNSLSQADRDVVHLRNAGFSLSEIAAALEISERSVSRVIWATRKKAAQSVRR